MGEPVPKWLRRRRLRKRRGVERRAVEWATRSLHKDGIRGLARGELHLYRWFRWPMTYGMIRGMYE